MRYHCTAMKRADKDPWVAILHKLFLQVTPTPPTHKMSLPQFYMGKHKAAIKAVFNE